MPRIHIVRLGQCVASIAYDHGFYPGTLWDHPENAELKRLRRSMNVLKPGDRVFIPDLQRKVVSVATDAMHRFRRRAVPDELNMIFTDHDGRPRSGLPYTVEVDGKERHGVTGSAGEIAIPIMPDAVSGRLVLHTATGDEVYTLELGHVAPITELLGVQQRLTNLGYPCLDEADKAGSLTRGALRNFQLERDLAVTGELDDATRHEIEQAYGG